MQNEFRGPPASRRYDSGSTIGAIVHLLRGLVRELLQVLAACHFLESFCRIGKSLLKVIAVARVTDAVSLDEKPPEIKEVEVDVGLGRGNASSNQVSCARPIAECVVPAVKLPSELRTKPLLCGLLLQIFQPRG